MHTDVKNGDMMDIRHYVRVVTVSGGSLAQCDYIEGVMFRKNLAHKRMANTIRGPRILVINGASAPWQPPKHTLTPWCVPDAIDYERAASGRISSLETLHEQEAQYTRLLVSKIRACGPPDLVVVARNASRLAIEGLQRAGVRGAAWVTKLSSMAIV